VPRHSATLLIGLTVAVTVGVFAQAPPPDAPPAVGQQPAGAPATPAQGRGAGPGQPPQGGGRGRRSFDPAALERAKAVYTPNCAFCHGADARGGTQGPDLARSLLVLSDENGNDIGALLKAGRPDKGMAAFPNLTDTQIADLAVYLHERVEAARSSAVVEAARQVVGDAAAGAAYFKGPGRCATCHSLTGDLKGIGAKYDAIALQDRFVNPRGGGGRGSGPASAGTTKTVTVTLPSGETASGSLIYISEFAVTLVDSGGHRRSITRNGAIPKVDVADPLQAHLDLMRTYKDGDIHNVTAYLLTIK
jgi:mono/diheme cytochrome c family protein